jgi:hypothetical protein
MSKSDTERRIAELEKEVALLRGKLAAYGCMQPVLSSLPDDAQTRRLVRAISEQGSVREVKDVRVYHPPDVNPSFVMPSKDELHRLYEITLRAHPQLAPQRRDSGEALQYFTHAFYRIGHLGRDKLESRYDLIGFAEEATIWLRQHGVTLIIRLLPVDFIAAVVAHGDVDYLPLHRFPYDCAAFGLRRDRMGRPATDTWAEY